MARGRPMLAPLAPLPSAVVNPLVKRAENLPVNSGQEVAEHLIMLSRTNADLVSDKGRRNSLRQANRLLASELAELDKQRDKVLALLSDVQRIDAETTPTA